jgi:hypothetical protein
VKATSSKWSRAGSALIVAGMFVAYESCAQTLPPVMDPLPGLHSVDLNPTSVTGPGTATGTVTLSAAAPSGGSTVTLQGSPSGAVSVPAQLVVPAGQSSGTFTVTLNAVTASTSVDVAATFSGSTVHATMVDIPASLVAHFIVTPDSGTGAITGQCAVTSSGDTARPNLLNCVFDGSSSTPQSAISSYTWTLPGLTSPITTTTPLLLDPKVGCGAGLNIANVQHPVTLTVGGSGGTATTGPIQVLFTKAGPC